MSAAVQEVRTSFQRHIFSHEISRCNHQFDDAIKGQLVLSCDDYTSSSPTPTGQAACSVPSLLSREIGCFSTGTVLDLSCDVCYDASVNQVSSSVRTTTPNEMQLSFRPPIHTTSHLTSADDPQTSARQFQLTLQSAGSRVEVLCQLEGN